MRTIPGLTRYGDVTLRRGITTNRDLWDWRQGEIDGQGWRRTVTITPLDEAAAPAMRRSLREAWIGRWEGPSLSASGNEVAIESIEPVHEGIRLE